MLDEMHSNPTFLRGRSSILNTTFTPGAGQAGTLGGTRDHKRVCWQAWLACSLAVQSKENLNVVVGTRRPRGGGHSAWMLGLLAVRHPQ